MNGRTVTLAGIALTAVVAISAFGALRWASAGSSLGDVNCDGVVNAIDAAVILQYDAGLLASLRCVENADANGDGLINALDAALVLQYDAGLIDSLGTPRPPTRTNTPTNTATSLPTTEPTITQTPTTAPSLLIEEVITSDRYPRGCRENSIGCQGAGRGFVFLHVVFLQPPQFNLGEFWEHCKEDNVRVVWEDGSEAGCQGFTMSGDDLDRVKSVSFRVPAEAAEAAVFTLLMPGLDPIELPPATQAGTGS